MAKPSLHGLSRTPFYYAWTSMLTRCQKPNAKDYPYYGGRGITVCERWLKFIHFRDDMLATYRPGLTLERKDVNGNYEPSNCRWATVTEQSNNRRNCRFITYAGKTLTIAQWSREVGLNHQTIWGRMKRGWPEESLLIPASSF